MRIFLSDRGIKRISNKKLTFLEIIQIELQLEKIFFPQNQIHYNAKSFAALGDSFLKFFPFHLNQN